MHCKNGELILRGASYFCYFLRTFNSPEPLHKMHVFLNAGTNDVDSSRRGPELNVPSPGLNMNSMKLAIL